MQTCTNIASGREKDELWQKSDALEFEQKLRDEETERDVNFCVSCNSQFSWWLRKHSCRSDGSLPGCQFVALHLKCTHDVKQLI